MRSMFLASAKQVAATVDDPVVSARWGDDSVLELQSIGSLCAHLARGGVWVVGEYLDRGTPDGDADFDSAGHYFASIMDMADESVHADIRQRGAELAEEGWGQVVDGLSRAVADLEQRLASEPGNRMIEVFGGKIMRLDDYLHTRIVEQVVHLDDLARSLERPSPRFAPGAVQVTIAAAMEIGRRRHGDVELMRSLYRDPTSGVLPVLH